MKLYLILTILLLSNLAQAEVVNTVKLGTPVRTLDSVTLAIEGHSNYIQPRTYDIVKYDITKFDITRFITVDYDLIKYEIAKLTPQEIQIVRYKLASYDVTKFDVTQWVNYIVTYDSVTNYGKELMDAVKSVRVSHYIQTKDYAKLQAELTGVIPTDKVQALIGYLEGTVKPVRQSIEWVLWKDSYDITKTIPEGDVFLLINDLNIGFEKLYDPYFNRHKGKTMAVFSWDVARENYIRQYMYQFIERYEDKIYAVIPNYGVQNNIDFKGDYADYYESVGQVVWWVKSNTNLPVGLTICSVRDDSDDRFAEAMKDLQICHQNRPEIGRAHL